MLEPLKQQYSKWLQIHFMGKRADVALFLQNSDVFVSASDSEGLPNAVLEALACGCSVILSDIPQHKEILDCLPNCGKLFVLHNLDTLASIMQECLQMRLSFGDSANAIEKSPLTMKKMGCRYAEYYKDVMEQNG